MLTEKDTLPEKQVVGRRVAAWKPSALCPQRLGSAAPEAPQGQQLDLLDAQPNDHVATLPLASLPRSNTAVPAASWAPPAEAWLARMYPLAELAEEVTTLSMVTGGACCTTWIAWPEGCCAVTMEAGM